MWEGGYLTPQITAPHQANVAHAYYGILNLRRAQPMAADVDDIVHPPRDLVMASLGSVSSVSSEVVACNPIGNSEPAPPNQDPAELASFLRSHNGAVSQPCSTEGSSEALHSASLLPAGPPCRRHCLVVPCGCVLGKGQIALTQLNAIETANA